MTTPEEGKLLSPRMLVAVTTAEDGGKLEKLLQARRVPIWYQCRGQGTAPSELMDIFGLSGTTRLVTVSLLPKWKARELFQAMAQRLSFRQKGGGIAISVPVTGLQRRILQLMQDEAGQPTDERTNEETMEETKESKEYTVIWASVDRGYSDDVVDAARAAGARGGTVIKGRRRSDSQAGPYLGVPAQEEQDFVMMIVPKAAKREIMAAINVKCGLGTDAHGVVLSLPVDEAFGLEK